MIPFGPILALTAIAARAAQQQRRGGTPPPKGPRRWTVAFWSLAAFGSVAVLVAAQGSASSLAWMLLLFPIALPWWTVRHLLVPFGWVRAAYALTWLADYTWHVDRRGGAALAAAWALLRRKRSDTHLANWIDERLRRGKQLKGGAVTAAGLLQIARGDLDGGRLLLASVATLHADSTPPEAARLAREWLTADAATRGEWHAVERLASGLPDGLHGSFANARSLSDLKRERGSADPGSNLKSDRSSADTSSDLRSDGRPSDPESDRRFAAAASDLRSVALAQALLHKRLPRSAATRFLGAVTTALLGGEMTRVQLVWRWLRAPERLETWALLRSALVALQRVAPQSPRPAEPAPDDGDALARAMTLHARMLARAPGELAAADVDRLGRAWDAALGDPVVRRQAAERALALGAQTGEWALQRVADSVEADMIALARAGEIAFGEAVRSALAGRAARALRDQLLSEIELASEAMRQRALEQRALPGIDEWREWLSLRALCERAGRLCGLPLRRLAFPKVHPDACKLAVWLWNQRGEKAIGHAIFRWLLDEAGAVGDERAVELQAKNVGCALD